jgi:hypothetical protein
MATKISAKYKQNWGAAGLVFIGSLLYLAIVFGGGINSASISGSYGSFWFPVLFGIAVVSSVALFFIGLSLISGMGGDVAWGAMKATVIGGFALSAISASSAWLLFGTVVGFVFGFVGSGFLQR